MASIQLRSTAAGKSWRVQYRIDGRATSTTFFDGGEAADYASLVDRIGGAAARAVLAAREGAHSSVTVGTYVADYVTRVEAITPGTRRDYERMVANRITGTVLGELPLEAVTRDVVAAWLTELPGATKTKRNYHALVSAALAHAVDEGLLASNPAKGVKVRQVEPVSDMVFLSGGELAVLVGALPAHYQPLVITLAGTGLRFGEATALVVGDVDLDGRVPVLRVNKAWQRTGTGAQVLGPPKTRAGVRTVSLPPEVAETLRPMLERRQDALLFTNVKGVGVRHSNFYDLVWRPTLDTLNEAGTLTKRPRIHDLRHSHASQLIAAGVPLNVIQRRLGHESIKTTVDRYGHLAPDYLEVSAAAASLGLAQAVPAIEG